MNCSYIHKKTVIGMMLSLKFCVLWVYNLASVPNSIHCLFSGLWFIITIPTFSHSFLSIMHVLCLYFHNLNGIHSPRPDPIPFPPGFPQTALSTSDSRVSLSSINSSSHPYHPSPLLRHLYHLCLLFFLNSSLWVCVDSSISLRAPEGQRPILLTPPPPQVMCKRNIC